MTQTLFATGEDAERRIEAVADELGLKTALKGALKSHRGCIHWHFQKPGARGTLEVTLLADRRNGWLSVHDNRTGDWVAETLAEFLRRLQCATLE